MSCQLQVTEVSFCLAPPKMFCSCFGLGFNVAETNFGNWKPFRLHTDEQLRLKDIPSNNNSSPFEFVIEYSFPASFLFRISEDNIHVHIFSIASPYNRGCVFFLSAFLIEEDTELQRTAAISDHLIKTLTGFLVKNDLDDSSYALMREVSTWNIGEGRVGMSSAVLDLRLRWWIDWRTTRSTSTTLAILKKKRPSPPHYLFRFVSLWLHIP